MSEYQGQDSDDGAIGVRHLVHRAELVSAVWVCCASVIDELGNHVLARCFDAEQAQVLRQMARTTADVGNNAWPNREVAGDQGEVIGRYLGNASEQFDVPLRQRSLCLPHGI